MASGKEQLQEVKKNSKAEIPYNDLILICQNSYSIFY